MFVTDSEEVVAFIFILDSTSHCDWLRPGRSGDRNPVGARFSAPVQTGPGAHPAYCTMGTESFPGFKSGRGVTLTPHPLLVSWSRKGRVIPLLPLWAVRPVQSLSAYTRVHLTLKDIAELSVTFFKKSIIKFSIRLLTL